MTTSFFQFSLRTVVNSGTGTRSLLPGILQGLGGKRAVLYTDQGLVNAGVVEKISQLFSDEPGSVQLVGIFDEIQQDARAEIVNRGAHFFRERHADTLIALGGGSVLDSVKGIKWMLHKNIDDIREVVISNTVETWPEAAAIPIPHVAIPTTAGTGAEVSAVAVIYNELAGVKTNLIHPFINADFALLDPELTVGLPPRITAFTGFDALTHAVEAYFSPQANPMADAFALQSIRMIVDHLPTAVHEGTNLEARSNMLIASTMAISAFFLSIHAIPIHNMAHAFGAKFGIPHGLANAVLLPSVMEALPSFYLGRIQGFAQALGMEAVPDDDTQCTAAVISFIRQLLSDVGLPDTFAEFNLELSELNQIVPVVQGDPAGVRFRIPAEVIANITNAVSGTQVEV